MARISYPGFLSKFLLPAYNGQGFALIDCIIASILLVTMAASLQTLFEISTRGVAFSNALDQADRDIHTVMNSVRQLGTVYHYCNDKGTVNLRDCGQSTAAFVQSPQAYYSPRSQDLDNFKNDCNADAKTDIKSDRVLNGRNKDNFDGLLAAINQIADQRPYGVSFVQNNGLNFIQDSKQTRRILITLSKSIEFSGSTRTLTRQFYFSPKLAVWCP